MATRMKLLVSLALIGAALVAGHALVTRTMSPADLLRLLAGEPALSDSRAAEVGVCLAGKEEVLDELLAGRLSLSEAADQFGRLEARRDGLPVTAKGRLELCDNVIRWARARLA